MKREFRNPRLAVLAYAARVLDRFSRSEGVPERSAGICLNLRLCVKHRYPHTSINVYDIITDYLEANSLDERYPVELGGEEYRNNLYKWEGGNELGRRRLALAAELAVHFRKLINKEL